MRRAIVAGLALLAVAAVVAMVVRGAGALPDQPVPIAWDREPCGHCHMHIGDPRHAAQLVSTAGEVTSFDDVGCALRFLDEHHPDVHRLWFHGEGDTWIASDRVGFVTGATTPMGSGLLAVEAGTPGARRLDQVRP